MAATGADRRRFEGGVTLRALAHRCAWFAVLRSAGPVLQRPLAIVVGETMQGDIPNVIQNHRVGLAFSWSQHPANLLQIQRL